MRDPDRIATAAPAHLDANDKNPEARRSSASLHPQRSCNPTAARENGAAPLPPSYSAAATRAERSGWSRSARRNTRSDTSPGRAAESPRQCQGLTLGFLAGPLRPARGDLDLQT